MASALPPLTDYLVTQLDKETFKDTEKTISVNPVVSEVATLYEKFRNAMDYREDDVLLRAAIARILKRRLIMGGTGESIAPSLVRELIWARYFPDDSVPEKLVSQIALKITLYLNLQNKVNHLGKIGKNKANDLIMDILSSDIAKVLSPNKEKDLLANFMFQTYRERVIISDDTEETRDVQVYVAIRRAFAKEDLPLLNYNLFLQIFGEVTEGSIDKIAENFADGAKEIERQLNYPLKDKIYFFIKRQSIPFFILEDVFKSHKGKDKELVLNIEEFSVSVLNSCQDRYRNIKSKVRRAIVRGVIFIFVTKAIFALAVEGTFESFFYGKVLWSSLALNTLIPPLLMVGVGLTIKTPGRDNSIKILDRIKQIIYSPSSITQTLILKKTPTALNPILSAVFIILWLLAFFLSFGTIVYILTFFGFNIISQGVFVFFLAIVSFISFRIAQTAHMYTMSDNKQNFRAILFDFLFMPVISIGRNLTENISKLNLFLFFFDFIIEAPFKGIFAFFEEWFLYLKTQREKLG